MPDEVTVPREGVAPEAAACPAAAYPAPPLLRATMPELDTVRGVAVLMVLVYHGFFWSARIEGMARLPALIVEATQPGWLGVQLFFVLSGFLITGILVDARERPDYFRRFYTRRARRILPAYLAILLLLAASRLAEPPFLLACVLFAANLTGLFGIAMQYGPLWSLAVEEQFYLVWPMLVRRLPRRTLAWLAGAIVVGTPALRYLAFRHGVVASLHVQTWFVSDGLAFGALGALFLRSRRATRRNVRRVSWALMIGGLTCIVIGAPFGIFHLTQPLGAALQVAPWHATFAGGMGLSLLLGTSRWSRLAHAGILRYCGRISYGLYLVHLLVFTGFDALLRRIAPGVLARVPSSLALLSLRFLIAGGVAVALAALSREYFEEYFLARRRAASRERLAAAIEAAPVSDAAVPQPVR